MAENNNAQPGRLKEIRITGAMVASVVGLIPQVSRLEEKLINMSMSSAPKMRSQVNNLTDRFQRALRAFEDELRAASKDAETDDRTPRRANRNNTANAQGGKRAADSSPTQQTPAAATSAVSSKQPVADSKQTAQRPQQEQQQGKKAQAPSKPQGQKQAQPATPAKPNSQQVKNPPKAKAKPSGADDVRTEAPTNVVPAQAVKAAEPAIPAL